MADERPEPSGSDEFNEPPSFFPRDEGDEPDPSEPRTMIEVEVEGVFQREDGPNVERFVMLRDRFRRLPIVIDPCNAHAISLPLDRAVPDRPLTHDLLKTVIERLGAEMDKVLIDDLWSTTYYARILLVRGKEEFEIDARPSDAIALAIRCNAPIFVSEAILDAGGV